MAPASTESPTDMMIAFLFYVRGHTKKNGMGCRPNCLHPSRGSIKKVFRTQVQIHRQRPQYAKKF